MNDHHCAIEWLIVWRMFLERQRDREGEVESETNICFYVLWDKFEMILLSTALVVLKKKSKWKTFNTKSKAKCM